MKGYPSERAPYSGHIRSSACQFGPVLIVNVATLLANPASRLQSKDMLTETSNKQRKRNPWGVTYHGGCLNAPHALQRADGERGRGKGFLTSFKRSLFATVTVEHD